MRGIPPATSPRPLLTVEAFSPPLPTPAIFQESLLAGVDTFSVGSVTHGATVKVNLTRAGSSTSWTAVCGESPCRIGIPPSLASLDVSDQIVLTQELCGYRSSEAREAGRACYEFAPAWGWPPHAGDQTVHMARFAYGATITIYECEVYGQRGPALPPPTNKTDCDWNPIGRAFDSSTINLVRPLVAGELLAATQFINKNCPPSQGAWIFVAGQ